MKLPCLCRFCEQFVNHITRCEKDNHWDHHPSCCPDRKQ